MKPPVLRTLLGVLFASLALTGCTVVPYCIGGCPGDGGLDGDRRDVRPIDARNPVDGCTPTSIEVCDGVDNDCDGVVDNGALPMVNEACGVDRGMCRRGTFECVAGRLVCGGGAVLPRAEACNGVDDDCNGMADDGDPGGGVACGSDVGECARGHTVCMGSRIECVDAVGPTEEVCDGRDNNCDEQIDEGNPGGGMPCMAGMGGCAMGVMRCSGGALRCVGGGMASAEVCDGVDNDCNSMIDEGFDLMTDARNCGRCANACAPMNAAGQCVAGVCAIGACTPGFHDLDGTVANGCEYACEFRGAEVCNGVDDDCDGMTDETLTPPAICAAAGECVGTTATCTGATGWVCRYGPTVSTGPTGDIVPETDCDNRDNDCDGRADDSFPMRATPCTRGLGVCATRGTLVCNATNDGLTCDATAPGTGTAETCNGLDDDCDGMVDDGAPDAWVTIRGSFTATRIYAYEASRPDSTLTDQGSMGHRPCSAPGRLPWTNVRHGEAQAACAAIGARLCTEAEWQASCQTTATTPCRYGYATTCGTYQPTVCNGNDLDSDPVMTADQDALRATGSLAMCRADWGAAGSIFDLSGNVKEWTAARSPGVNPLRGGSFNNPPIALTCQHAFEVADDDFLFNNVGFRCCAE